MDAEVESKKEAGTRSRNVLIAVLVVLLVGVTTAVIKIIEQAPGAGGPGGGPPGGGGGPPPAAVYVRPLEREVTREEAVVTGTLRALSQADVAAQEPGAVAAVLVDEGQEVARGDVLARLDGRRLTALHQQAQAQLTSARSAHLQRLAEFARAEEDVAMKRGLRETEAVSESDLLDAQTALAVAAARRDAAGDSIREAEARVAFLDVQREDLTIIAPFDGAVVDRRVEPGEWVAAGAVVASLVTIDPVEAWLRVPARYLGRTTSEAGAFQVRQSSTGKLFRPVKVERVPEVDPLSQLFVVVATIPNAARELTPGESVAGIIPVGTSRAYWRVPADAVVHGAAGRLIFTASSPAGQGGLPTARPVPVEVAFERGGFAYLETGGAGADGLAEGDPVVVEGNERLQPGQPLLVRPADTGGGGGPGGRGRAVP